MTTLDWHFIGWRLHAVVDTTPRLYLRERLTIIALLLCFAAFAARIIVLGR